MVKKKKFNPEITRIRLNPEQAVLGCECYDAGFVERTGASYRNWVYPCVLWSAKTTEYNNWWASGQITS